MNLTDIDLTRATPIDFDDIREGDTVIWTRGPDLAVITVERAGTYGAHGGKYAAFNDETDVSWFLLSRPSPCVEPGTTGTATVAGVKEVRVMRLDDANSSPAGAPWVDEFGDRHAEGDVTDFVPNPLPGVPQELRDALADLAIAHVAAERTRTLNEALDIRTAALGDFLDTVARYEARDV